MADGKGVSLTGRALDEDIYGGAGATYTREVAEVEEEDEEMDPGEATRPRGIAARANYLGIDRPDIQYATKEVCRDMAKPRRSSWDKLKRLARYLLEYPRVVWEFVDEGGDFDKFIAQGYGDSGWAGCRASRRSKK